MVRMSKYQHFASYIPKYIPISSRKKCLSLISMTITHLSILFHPQTNVLTFKPKFRDIFFWKYNEIKAPLQNTKYYNNIKCINLHNVLCTYVNLKWGRRWKKWNNALCIKVHNYFHKKIKKVTIPSSSLLIKLSFKVLFTDHYNHKTFVYDWCVFWITA